MSRKLFCEISPLTYRISEQKEIWKRKLTDRLRGEKLATRKSRKLLPVRLYSHNSLIRRRLGNVDMQLQENKAVNLKLAAKNLNGLLIYPGEVFSFWHLVGKTTAQKGYLEGLVIKKNQPNKETGGGLCQLTNGIHWLILHTPLLITEHHHHDQYDLFPDFGRTIPFGTGTSISYNYIDYRFKNTSDQLLQLIVYTTAEHLCLELRGQRKWGYTYHIFAEDEFFQREGRDVYRHGRVCRSQIDPLTGRILQKEIIKINHAKVMYDPAGLEIREERRFKDL